MKMKENVRFFVIAGCVFLLIYIFLAAKPLGEELSLSPIWTISVTDRQNALQEADSAESVLPFKLGQNMGYFTHSGKIAYLESYPFKASISSKYRAAYSPDAANIPIYAFDAGLSAEENAAPAGIIQGSGFPFFVEDRIFLFMPGGFGISQHNPDGSQRWAFTNYVPVVSFSSSGAGTAVGFADGSIVVFSPNGEIRQVFEPGGSTYPVILGTALSESGTQLACVSGIDRQRFVLTQEKNGLSRVVFHTYLDADQREPVLVQFSKDEQKVFYSSSAGLGVVDCQSMNNKTIRLGGKILSIQELPHLNMTCVLSKDLDEYSVHFIEGFDNLVGSFSFEAETAFITTNEEYLFIGKNTEISCIKMEFN